MLTRNQIANNKKRKTDNSIRVYVTNHADIDNELLFKKRKKNEDKKTMIEPNIEIGNKYENVLYVNKKTDSKKTLKSMQNEKISNTQSIIFI